VAGLRVHDLRHGLATQAARDGASALVIRDLLGHKTLAMANRYVARVQDEALAAQRRAGAAVGASLAPASRSGAGGLGCEARDEGT
jgi:integrase